MLMTFTMGRRARLIKDAAAASALKLAPTSSEATISYDACFGPHSYSCKALILVRSCVKAQLGPGRPNSGFAPKEAA